MNKDELVSVVNRNNGFTGYSIPDMNIWRNFAPKERKNISLDELKQLQFQPGGDYILENYLIIENEEALAELNMLDKIEQEYSYRESDIKRILLEGSLDELKDFLDFAPAGAVELAKTMAVDLKIPDMRKREAITEMTGFNITNAINVNIALEDVDKTVVTAKKERRVKESEEGKKTRRIVQTVKDKNVSVPSYKVVEK